MAHYCEVFCRVLTLCISSCMSVNCLASASMKNGFYVSEKWPNPNQSYCKVLFYYNTWFKFYFNNRLNGFSLFTCPLIVLKHVIPNEREINIWFFLSNDCCTANNYTQVIWSFYGCLNIKQLKLCVEENVAFCSIEQFFFWYFSNLNLKMLT